MPEQQMTPEQQEELKEKIENMSPEELKEYQKQQCVFCHIVSGKVAAKKVYEDDKVIAILDINPANPGHVVLMPKEHHMIMPQLPEDELLHIFIVAKHLSNVLLRTLDVRGTNIIVANGPAAGQRAQHFMIHIIPRREGDGVEFKLPSNKQAEEVLDNIAQMVRKRLNEILGVKEEKKTAMDIIKERKKKVVEADFKEKPKKKEEKKAEEKKAEEKKAEEKKDEVKESKDEAKEEKDDEIDLDDIARVLNG